MKASQILNDPFMNKGTAFTESERRALGLVGVLPPAVQTLEQQAAQVYACCRAKKGDAERRHFLMEVFNTNRTLFYRVFKDHIAELNPIVYDPTIADSIEHYSERFIDPQYAAFLSIDSPDDIEASLENAAGGREIRLIVVTDAEEILGIGDWGTNGVDISVGKLMVYTAAAGIDPACVLPVVIDAGTDRKELLEDDLYLGNRHRRVRGERYHAFIDRFVDAAEALFPHLYLHWEDFGRDNAAKILERHRKRIPTFNDDIQGTGIITLAGILGAMEATGGKLTDQTYLCFGAGTAGAGIAHRVFLEMVEEGLSEEEARSRFYLVDRQGLLFDDMDDLTPEQRPFARRRGEFPAGADLTKLVDIVRAVQPTIMVGTSTVHGAFTEEVVREMAAHTQRPIIFPLSNPTSLAEATARDLIAWTDGRALVATGIPSDPVEHEGVTYHIGQANNALIYPGLGMGVLASEAELLTDEMISAAAHALNGLVDESAPGAPVLPPVEKLATFSFDVALAVAKTAQEQGLATARETDMSKAISALVWEPEYRDAALGSER